ncbi:hypothetical protein Tco_0521057 [Tanacetum coccineum]
MKSQQSTNAFVKETFIDLKTQLETVAKNHQASIQNLENKFDRLADKQSGRPSGSLPSNTQPNPKGHNSKAYQPLQSRNEHVNPVFTRSGKSYNPPVNPNDQQDNSETLINFDSDDEDEKPTPQPKTQPTKPVKETPLPKPYKPKILVRKTSSFAAGTSRTHRPRIKWEAIPGKQRTVSTNCKGKSLLVSENSVNSSEPTLSIRPTNVEVPKELPKVSMVNTSLKKLKYHLANFDVVVKERTTPTAITEGSWGFEHTKACFRDEIIPFVKALKDLFSTFNQHLVDELSEVQNVFYQMEQAVEQHRIESKTFEVKMNQVLNKNERLLEQVMSKDIVNLLVNPSVENDSVNMHECQKCLKLKTELQMDFVKRETYDKLFKSFTILEKHCISLEVDTQLKQEIFQRENSISNQSVPSFDQLFELNELKAQS